MADQETKKVCAHEGCSCPVENDGEFCSQVCEATEHKHYMTITCGCGHDACKGEISNR
jgi:hypothetical protein